MAMARRGSRGNAPSGWVPGGGGASGGSGTSRTRHGRSRSTCSSPAGLRRRRTAGPEGGAVRPGYVGARSRGAAHRRDRETPGALGAQPARRALTRRLGPGAYLRLIDLRGDPDPAASNLAAGAFRATGAQGTARRDDQAGSRSHATQRDPSHQRCQVAPSVPRVMTERRSGPHDAAAGTDDGSSDPPSDSHGCQLLSSQ